MGSPPPPKPSSRFTNVNGTMYFTHYDSISGEELWKIDRDGNSVLVKDINPGVASSYPYFYDSSNLINVDGTLYFQATDTNTGKELWKIDSEGNPGLVKDINPGVNSSEPSNLTNVNGTLYFTASNTTNGQELWQIDRAGNAVLVKDINPGVASSYPSNITNVNGTLYFTASSTTGQELWKIDPTGAAVLVKDFSSGTDSSRLSSLTNVDGTIYFMTDNFTENNIAKGHELWKIDNTGDVVLVRNFSLDRNYYSPEFTNVNGTLYFKAPDTNTGTELWKIDSTGNAVLVKDINPGAGSSKPYDLINVEGTLYFTASDTTPTTITGRETDGPFGPNTERELWRIDSSGNAVLVKEIDPSANFSDPSFLTNINGTLYFRAYSMNTGTELWKVDSTGNAVLVKDINPGANSSSPSNLTNINGTLYFRAFDTTNKIELWQLDNTSNTVSVKDINPGADSSEPYNLTNVEGTLYFNTYNYTTNGTDLWKIDSVAGGGIPVVSPLRLTPDKLFNNNLLETTSAIRGVSIQAVSQKQSNKVNEIGFFNVDDRTGKIDGIAPGKAGYTKAAIDRAKTFLTTLGGDFFNTEKQEIGLDSNKIYQFFEIENGSLEDVKQKLNRGENPLNIRLSNLDANGYSPIKVTGNSLQSGYNVSINNDELVLKVTKLDGITPNRPIGSESQGKSEGRIIDLTKYANQTLKVDITTKSDAVYQSQIGFYAVKDASGTIELADGTTIKPGDEKYAMIAVKNAIANAGLQANRLDSKTNQPIAGGQIYAPVVVAQGTMDDFMNKTSNNVHAYFNYVSANADKVDHFRQIGANTFGVEDMYGGGDRDFNDLVIQMNVKTI